MMKGHTPVYASATIAETRRKLALEYCRLGDAYRDLGRYASAAGCFLDAIRIDESSARAYYGLGTIHQLEGRFGPARAALRRSGELSVLAYERSVPLVTDDLAATQPLAERRTQEQDTGVVAEELPTSLLEVRYRTKPLAA